MSNGIVPREPTEAMIAAGQDAAAKLPSALPPLYAWEVCHIWHAMYDAAHGSTRSDSHLTPKGKPC